MRSSIFQFAFILAAAAAIFFLLFMNESDRQALSDRINRYEAQADSLRAAVQKIDVNIHQKDSILLVYLASLDKTLEELDKESAKNSQAIQRNLIKQDSIRAAYCREMAALHQQPEECQ